MISNCFNELRHCIKPKKKDFQRTEACQSFSKSSVPFYECNMTSKWLLAKSLEFIISKSDNSLSNEDMLFTNELMIPTWSGSNSLLGKTIDKKDLTNIFNTPLVNGSASDYSAIFTGISMANDISQYLRGYGSKAIISLDLDLYEKVYLLVNSREDLRNRYVICLGELHITFAYLRAIGTYIESSGLDDCWTRAKLFGDNTCRQVLTCARLNRALQCHESIWIAISIHVLQTIVTKNLSTSHLASNSLVNILSDMQVASQEKNDVKFKESFKGFIDCIDDIKIDSALEDYKSEKEANSMFRYICCYLEMLSHLFDFIYASRARNWKLHLSSLQNMMPAIIMMDRIKYI